MGICQGDNLDQLLFNIIGELIVATRAKKHWLHLGEQLDEHLLCR